jgi:hypothetical protein
LRAARILRRMGHGSATTSASRSAAPASVIGAVVVVALSGIYRLTGLGGNVDGLVTWIAGGVAVLVYGLIAYGLWRGNRGAQIIAVVGGGIEVLSGLALMGRGEPGLLGVLVGGGLIALVLVPESSRAWFAR